VNQILTAIGLTKIGANTVYVPSVEAGLKAGRGVLIKNPTEALPGDIVIQADQGHIGICATSQCTTVYSNSSSHGAFSNPTGPDIFLTIPGRIYRVIK
jgi:hypothetical protein